MKDNIIIDNKEYVSILVAMYNAEKSIEKCICSLLAQDYVFTEIIIVNDGSTDNSLGVVETLSKEDKRIKIISIPNGGLAHARNVGINNCSGDYFCFIDADDYVEKDYVSTLMRGIKNSHCSCCFSGIKTDKGDGIMKEIEYDKDMIISFDDDIKLFDNHIFHINSAIYSSLSCKHILFDERVPAYGEDYLYRIKLLRELRKASYVRGTPYVYTDFNNQSITNDNSNGKFGFRAKCLIQSRLIIFEIFNDSRLIKRKVCDEALNILIVYYSNAKKWKIPFKKRDYKDSVSMIMTMRRFLSIRNRLLFFLQCFAPIINYKLYFLYLLHRTTSRIGKA